jgi:CheY-like chemotaxis protein
MGVQAADARSILAESLNQRIPPCPIRDPMNSTETQPMGLLLSQDLFFASKVTGTAAALGFRVSAVRDAAQALAEIANSRIRCLIVDLATPDLDVTNLVRALPATGRPTVIAFEAHVLADRLQAARDAGCDEVMPRSKFSATLPEILRRCLS